MAMSGGFRKALRIGLGITAAIVGAALLGPALAPILAMGILAGIGVASVKTSMFIAKKLYGVEDPRHKNKNKTDKVLHRGWNNLHRTRTPHKAEKFVNSLAERGQLSAAANASFVRNYRDPQAPQQTSLPPRPQQQRTSMPPWWWYGQQGAKPYDNPFDGNAVTTSAPGWDFSNSYGGSYGGGGGQPTLPQRDETTYYAPPPGGPGY